LFGQGDRLMYRPSLDEVREMGGKADLVPVYRELPADLETPVSVYLKLRGHGPSFLLESVERGEQVGRYSFLGSEPSLSFMVDGDDILLRGNGRIERRRVDGDDPLDVVREILRSHRLVGHSDLPRFTGGAVGYLGYDMVRFFEPKLQSCLGRPGRDSFSGPDAFLMFADQTVIFDHVKHRLLIVAHARLDGDVQTAYSEATARIEDIVARLRRPLSLASEKPPGPSDARLISKMARHQFEEIVRQGKEYIAAGDIYQVVLSQRFQRQTSADPFTIYRALRMLNPSPYMFYLDLGDQLDGDYGPLRLIGSSPEMLVRLEGGIAEVRPIAGTRRRGATQEEDDALAQELLADPKERAEHVMLVDLGRNDLGRVCYYGTVHTPEFMTVERYSHVMHIVSSVKGTLRAEADAFDLLRATFPAGTVSGAPKIRAMEIIEELEGLPRGPYAGAVGYIGYGGAMDTCITIRTIVMQGDGRNGVSHAYVQAGAGIVADSDPAHEHEECVNKAAALAEAITIAERGLE